MTCVLRVDEPGVFRVQAKSHGIRCWLGGQELAHGDIVSFTPGHYTHAIVLSVGRLPPFMRDRKLIASAFFGRWLGNAEKRLRWQADIARHRPVLDAIIRGHPEGSWVGQLRAMLQVADDPTR